jgi:hypothetical protein
MKTNIGTLDRTIRVILAAIIAILLLAKLVHGTLAIVLGILGPLFLITAGLGFCGLYVPFKISTRKKQDSTAK